MINLLLLMAINMSIKKANNIIMDILMVILSMRKIKMIIKEVIMDILIVILSMKYKIIVLQPICIVKRRVIVFMHKLVNKVLQVNFDINFYIVSQPMVILPDFLSLRCQAHWKNTQSQRYNQILPKNLPALPTPTHGLKDIAAKINDKFTKDKNDQLATGE